ncbi:hypothetical protein FVEG_14071 [Fusarium verticillioides 7600]|uniref:Uncharacterized protein n=1 Tax=Gibberella moniliformis (strain M3125 / FGSC 7600) TaxID=334819 RepID=W7MXZ8_GIBM7|nr:hypothetical protein FVEG_14071 [Fusarium verticillioides 7600]EWG55968.1 hypothetical protein FVEG_14071 [Fusarium verticillioides 7600]
MKIVSWDKAPQRSPKALALPVPRTQNQKSETRIQDLNLEVAAHKKTLNWRRGLGLQKATRSGRGESHVKQPEEDRTKAEAKLDGYEAKTQAIWDGIETLLNGIAACRKEIVKWTNSIDTIQCLQILRSLDYDALEAMPEERQNMRNLVNKILASKRERANGTEAR